MAPPTASDRRPHWTEYEVELLLGRLLQWGVGVAAVVVLIGGAVYLARHGGERPHYGAFVGEPANLRGVLGIAGSAADRSGRGLIQLGLLVLIATPVARVAGSLLVFVRNRDGLYVALSLFVLVLLLASLAGLTP